MLPLILVIIGIIIAYFIYSSIKGHKEKVRLEEEKKKKQAIQQARENKARQEYWNSLPAFYATIPKQNYSELLRALENYEYNEKKYPLNRAITDPCVNPREITLMRHEFMDDIEKYSGHKFLDFCYRDLHIKFMKQNLGVKIYQ